MKLTSNNQINLYGLNSQLIELIELYKKNRLPNKILLSGQKGIGKCTLAYHLINYILSIDEEHNYDLINFSINIENKSFKLIQNKTNPNFILIDVADEKKKIDISQIRNMINNLNKSSFNSKPRFVLIDNIEYLNLNSVNALLKILEDPTKDTHFILVNNNKKVLPTLQSRCLNFKIHLSNSNNKAICNKLLNIDIDNAINIDLLDYYLTPGKIYNLTIFSNENKIDLKKISLKEFLILLIDESHYKKNNFINYIIYDFIELFLKKNISISYIELYNYFLKKINHTKKFNLDEEIFFIEFKSRFLNE